MFFFKGRSIYFQGAGRSFASEICPMIWKDYGKVEQLPSIGRQAYDYYAYSKKAPVPQPRKPSQPAAPVKKVIVTPKPKPVSEENNENE